MLHKNHEPAALLRGDTSSATDVWTIPTASAAWTATRSPVDSVSRASLIMGGLWLFIGLVAAYDVYLSIKYQEVLYLHELNPLGMWLLNLDGGRVAVFMGCKFAGTVITLGVIQLLYLYQRKLGMAVAAGLALVQAMVAGYLIFG